MKRNSPLKIGVGSGLILLGVYLLFSQKEILGIASSIVSIAVGIGLVASS